MLDGDPDMEIESASLPRGNKKGAGFDEPGQEEVLHTNRCYVVTFMITILLGSAHVGYSMSSANQLATEFNNKYHWETDSEQAIHQSYIGASIVCGLSAGALIGSYIIPIGRRKTLLIFNVVGLAGVTMVMFQNIWMLLFGRLIYGFAVGVNSVAMPRYLDEVIPLRLYNICIAMYVTSINVGFLFALDGAIFLPKDY